MRPPGLGVARLGFSLIGLGCSWQANRTARYHSGDRVLVDHLADRVLQQDDELVEGLDLTLQLDAVDQVDGCLLYTSPSPRDS